MTPEIQDEDILNSDIDASLRGYRLMRVCQWVQTITSDPYATQAADLGYVFDLLTEEVARLNVQVEQLYKDRKTT